MTVATEKVIVEPTSTPEVKTDEQVFYSNESIDSKVEGQEANSEANEAADTSQEPPKEPVVDGVIEYDLKLEEGSHLVQADLDSVLEFAKEHKLSNEVAKAMLQGKHEAMSKYAENLSGDFEKQVEAWGNEVQADKELGGDNYPKTQERARNALEKFGSEELTKTLVDTGYQNFPPLVKFLSKIGSLLEQDSLELSKETSSNEKTIEEVFYGN